MFHGQIFAPHILLGTHEKLSCRGRRSTNRPINSSLYCMSFLRLRRYARYLNFLDSMGAKTNPLPLVCGRVGNPWRISLVTLQRIGNLGRRYGSRVVWCIVLGACRGRQAWISNIVTCSDRNCLKFLMIWACQAVRASNRLLRGRRNSSNPTTVLIANKRLHRP